MDASLTTRTQGAGTDVPPAERFVRRVLRVPADGPEVSLAGANNAFSTSIAISAVRCLITYVALPLLRPALDLSGGVGPSLGLFVGFVSIAAIIIAMRRFWAADHPWAWRYTVLAAGILVFLVVAAAVDVMALV